MWNRVIGVVACGLLLAGCQQGAGPRATLLGPTSPATSSSSTHTNPAMAVDVPFSGTLTGEAAYIPNPRNCDIGFTTVTDAQGTASHLGRTIFHSEHCIVPTPDGGQIVGGVLVLTAANGDELHGTYTGSFGAFPPIGEPIVVTGTWIFSGGTGRFANASGTAQMSAKVIWEGMGDPSNPGRWEWSGALRY
jgi:hypothetical protein